MPTMFLGDFSFSSIYKYARVYSAVPVDIALDIQLVSKCI